MDRVCAHCHKFGATKLCSLCRVQRYCDKTCQRADWPGHRPMCSKQMCDEMRLTEMLATHPMSMNVIKGWPTMDDTHVYIICEMEPGRVPFFIGTVSATVNNFQMYMNPWKGDLFGIISSPTNNIDKLHEAANAWNMKISRGGPEGFPLSGENVWQLE